MDVVTDFRRRAPYYFDDFHSGWRYGLRIFAPATYIFFASLLPAVSFGVQLSQNTDGTLTVIQVLVSTAISGLLQTFVGGQPLVINGVAQPIVTIYTFMYSFAKSRSDFDISLFLPWAAWVCVWSAILLVMGAVFGVCRLVHRFTRMAGEIFGIVVAVLFLQQAIMGLISEFRPEPSANGGASTAAQAKGGGYPDKAEAELATTGSGQPGREEDEPWWILVNGLWGLFLASGFVFTAVLSVTARSWRFGTSTLRGLLADYGVPLLVVIWSALSYALQSGGNPRGVPSGLPRRVTTPLTWQVTDTWGTVTRMGKVPGPYIAVALVPGAIIAVLFWFDHGVSSKMAQQKEYNLQKPHTYAWDQCLLSVFVLIAGFIGLPPPNGVLPQCPLHTRVCCTLRMTAEEDKKLRQTEEEQGGAKSEEEAWDPIKVEALNQELSKTRTTGDHCLFGPDMEHQKQLQMSPLCLPTIPSTSALTCITQNGNSSSVRGCSGQGSIDEFCGGQLCGGSSSDLRVGDANSNTQGSCYQLDGRGIQGVVEQQAEQQAGGHKAIPDLLAHSLTFFKRLGHQHHRVQLEGSGIGVQQGSKGNEEVEQGSNRNLQACQVALEGDARGYKEAYSLVSQGEVEEQQQQQHHHHHHRHHYQHQHHFDQQEQQHQQQQDRVGSLHREERLQDCNQPQMDPGGEAPQEEGDNGEEAEAALELRVAEQRLTNLIQSLCVVASLGAVHILRLLPMAVVWAYFAYMSIESITNSQLWDRTMMMFTDPRRRSLVLTRLHASYMETVPFRVVAVFTLLEIVYLVGVWALVSWAGIGGIAFPGPIIALVPIRTYLLPRLFKPEHLADLDADEYDVLEPLSHDQAMEEIGQTPYDIRDIIEDQYSGTQVMHRVSHDVARMRTRSHEQQSSLARATAPAHFYQISVQSV